MNSWTLIAQGKGTAAGQFCRFYRNQAGDLMKLHTLYLSINGKHFHRTRYFRPGSRRKHPTLKELYTYEHTAKRD